VRWLGGLFIVGVLCCVVVLPGTRQALRLEDHWRAESRPQAAQTAFSKHKRTAETHYFDKLEDLCNQFPPPEDYNVLEEGPRGGTGDKEAPGMKHHSSGFTFAKVPPGFL
jgi:hypothetical protein